MFPTTSSLSETPSVKDDQMPPGTRSIDDATIRARCATPEAVRYTLYVRGLVSGPGAPGGQAEILRIAAERRLLPTANYNRQTLSEHLSGRYRHGPPWETTEMIIECLSDHAPKARIRDEAAELFRAADRRQSRRQNTADLAWPEASGTGLRWERHANAVPGRHAAPYAPRPIRTGGANAPRASAGARLGGNAVHGGYRPGPNRNRLAGDAAGVIANLRAECARLAVQVTLASDPETEPARYARLSTVLVEHRRSRLGQLADQIDPTAPLMRRALAQYLCAYAELGGTDATELAIRTGLTVAAVAEILAAKRVPTDTQLAGLSAVLGIDDPMVWHLASHARAG